MLQPAHVGLEELAQVRNAVFEHRDAVDAEAPGETLVLGGIEPAIPQHVGMHHAAAHHFQPVGAFADLQLVTPALAAYIDFGGRFGKREEAGAEAHRHIVDFKKCLEEFDDGGFAGVAEPTLLPLEDARVSARPVGKSGAEVVKELGYRSPVGQPRQREPAGMQRALFRQRDELLQAALSPTVGAKNYQEGLACSSRPEVSLVGVPPVERIT